MGVAINIAVIIVAYILGGLTHISFAWIEVPLLVLIALGMYFTGVKFWHPLWFIFGLIFGLIIISFIIGILIGLGIVASALVFG